MTLSKQIRDDLRTALDAAKRDSSPVWHHALAGLLETIAANIRAEIKPRDTTARIHPSRQSRRILKTEH